MATWDFTVAQIKEIETYAANGGTNESISAILGVSERTYRRAKEKNKEAQLAVRRGKAKMILSVAGKLGEAAMRGEAWAICFLLKTQAGYRETNRHEISGEDGKPIETKSAIKLTIKDYRSDGSK